MRKLIATLGLVVITASASPAWAQAKLAPRAKSLKQLLELVKGGWRADSTQIKAREAEFKADRNNRKTLLKQAQATLTKLQKQSEALEKEFDHNEALVPKLEETLKTRLGTMGELFGVIRQMAGTARANLANSLVNIQYPGRGDKLEPLTKSRSLPSIDQLQTLWYQLQHEMIESGKVSRFATKVVTANGDEQELDVVRIGVFNAVARGKYLVANEKNSQLVELARQPSGRYLSTLKDLEQSQGGYVRVAIDPSGGQLLSVLVQTPTFLERIPFGGVIGYIIIALGLATFLLALLRLAYLTFVNMKVRLQQRSKQVKTNNPLGRVLGVYGQNPNMDTETLELKFDEAIIRESARLNRGLWAVKIVSVVAPLMGLLGTVTGMIQTFQAITMYGTGDPKTMAGGISEALVTTMLGLMVAIPLVLLHSWMSSMSRRMVEVMEEQSTGIVAKRREEICRADSAG
jgi:biopolymer transport protein ExbB